MILRGLSPIDSVFNRGYAPMFKPNATQEEVMYALAKCVPAISSPVGGNVILGNKQDFNLNDGKYRRGWGRDKLFWQHSDMKDMAYFYVFPLYDELVTKGSVK